VTVIAQEGSWYLVDVGNGLGRVLDLEFQRFFPPHSLTSLLAKGSWQQFRGDADVVLASIPEVQDLAPEATAGEHFVHA
jgi:hypothetical protein